MLEKFYTKNLKKIPFDLEHPIKEVDDLWVISITDEDGNPSATLFYAKDGFRLRYEDGGKYSNSLRDFKDEDFNRHHYTFYVRNYESLKNIFGSKLQEALSWSKNCWYWTIDYLDIAKSNGEDKEEELKELAEEQKKREEFLKLGFDRLPEFKEIEGEIKNLLKDRLVLNFEFRYQDLRYFYSPCGHELTPREIAEIAVEMPGSIECPHCGKKHLLLIDSDYLCYAYLKVIESGGSLLVLAYKFGIRNFDFERIEIDPTYMVMKITKTYCGNMALDTYRVCENKAENTYLQDKGYFNLSSITLYDPGNICKILREYGEYGNKVTNLIEYFLYHPDGSSFKTVFYDSTAFPYNFIAKHELYYLLKEDDLSRNSLYWLVEHPEYISFVKNEEMTLQEIMILGKCHDNERHFTRNDLLELRKYSPADLKNLNLLDLDFCLRRSSLAKILKYFSTQSKYDFNILADYWWMLETLPGDRMSDDKTKFPKNLIREHDIVYAEVKIRKNAYERQKQIERAKAIPRNWCNLFDQGYVDSNDEFVITPFESAKQIEEEGTKQHICIGSDFYINDYADGETLLCALRKKDDPETPYVAFEIRNNHLVQARAKYNGIPDASALNYIKEYCHARGIAA